MSRLRFTALFLVLLSWVAPLQAQEVEVTEEARQHFTAGVNFMQDPDGARYEEAFREFKAAYTASPSWKILGNLGICAMKLERDGEAIDAMSQYLSQGGDALSADEREQFERDLSTLKASVVQVRLSSVPAGAVFTDERIPVQGNRVINRYGPESGELALGIRAGHHRITARLEGYEDAVWEFDAVSGPEQAHVFELKPPGATDAVGATAATTSTSTAGPAEPMDTGADRPVPTSVYIGLGATGLFAVATGVTGALALGKAGEYDDANDGQDESKAKKLKSDTESMNLMADIFLGAAVVSAGVTAILYFTRPASSEQAGVTVAPAVGASGAGMTLSGTF